MRSASYLVRFFALVAFAFWQGGFTFYVAVVVPTARHVFGNDMDQAMVTRQVTVWLNLAGVVTLAILALEILGTRDPSARRRWWRWLAWLGMVGGLAFLFWLHPQLDRLVDLETSRVLDRKTFRLGHKTYLWTSTIQWGCAVVYLWLTPAAWRAETAGDSIGKVQGA